MSYFEGSHHGATMREGNCYVEYPPLLLIIISIHNAHIKASASAAIVVRYNNKDAVWIITVLSIILIITTILSMNDYILYGQRTVMMYHIIIIITTTLYTKEIQ